MEQNPGPELYEASLLLASRGLRVLPVHGVIDRGCTCPKGTNCDGPGKHPRLNEWPEQATTDAEAIRGWWKKWPDSNVGIATGSGSRIVVLDIDPANGGDDSFAGLERECGNFPSTVEVITGGGGRHLYFAYDADDVRNSAGMLGLGLDIRGEGGFVVAPPSMHISGRRYEWEASSHPEDVPISDLPSSLSSKLSAPRNRSKRNDPGWVGEALKGVSEGQRNDVAAKLAGYYMKGGLAASQVAVLLESTFGPNCHPPMEAAEIDGVVESVVRTHYRRNGTGRRQHASTAGAERPDSGVGRGSGNLATEQPVPKRPADFPLTDTGNAELIAYQYGDRLRFDHRQGRWLAWAEHHWINDPDGEPVRLAIEAARVRFRDSEHILDTKERERAAKWAIGSEARPRIDAALHIAKNLPPVADSGEGWDSDSWLLGCANGIVDLRTGNLRPGRPEDRMTMSTAVAYDPTAKAPRFERFLEEVFEVDDQLIDYVQRALGYSTTGDVSEQSIHICCGQGANGKSTFFNAIRSALGDYAHNAPFSAFEARARDTIPTEIADLDRRRFVTASETGESRRLNESRVKALSGGDPISARHLFGRFFTFDATCKIWLGVNHRPAVKDDSHGFWRRVRLIPFDRQFGEGEADSRLIERLRGEAEGILVWLVKGARHWQDFGLHAPESVLDATEAYREESDPLAEFLAQRCEIDGGLHESSRDLFDAYSDHAEQEGIPKRERLTHAKFGRLMGGRFEGKRTSGGKVYHGVRLQK